MFPWELGRFGSAPFESKLSSNVTSPHIAAAVRSSVTSLGAYTFSFPDIPAIEKDDMAQREGENQSRR